MGLFDFLKPKSGGSKSSNGRDTIPDSEKKYYRSDDYYTTKTYEGTAAEGEVITFNARKRTSIPSSTGLYVAEILLLAYCAQGTYPHPKNGYPGFWWFEYGIRDVGAALSSLEERGYIEFGPITTALNDLTAAQLKTMLKDKGQPSSGSKDNLIDRVYDCYSDDELIDMGLEEKYVLTQKGKAELRENQYVPYMHKNPHKTIEGCDPEFTVWSINRILGKGDKSDWKQIVDEQYEILQSVGAEHEEEYLEYLQKYHPEDYKYEVESRQQLNDIQRANERYRNTRDIETYIRFWEDLWESGGVKFLGVKWNFELADLYIRTKRYDDAIKFLQYLKKIRPEYTDRANEYIEKIKQKKATAK